MKQKDIIIIIVVVFFSAIFSYILANKIITTPTDRQQQVQVIPSITDQFSQPDPKYFNPQADDPTVLIQIAQSNSQAQFNGN